MGDPASKRKWWAVAAGVVVLLCVVAAGLGVAAMLWFRDRVDMRPGVGRAAADAAFAQEKAAFADARPLLVMGDDRRPRYAGGLDTRKNPGRIGSLRVVAWDHEDGQLATIAVPFWLVRMKSGSFRFGQYVSGMDDHGVQLDAKDLERYGPGVVLETTTPEGDHVIITTR